MARSDFRRRPLTEATESLAVAALPRPPRRQCRGGGRGSPPHSTSRGHSGRLVLSCAVLLLLVAAARAEEDRLEAAREHKKTAVAHLRKADTQSADKRGELKAAEKALVAAQSILSKYEEPVPPEVEEELGEINSLLYWTRKMMPLDAGAVRRAATRKPLPPPRVEDAPKIDRGAEDRERERKEALARRNFEAAQRYARSNRNRPFLVAVRYFEVANRFMGTPWGLKAQSEALRWQAEAMSAGNTKPRPAPRRPDPVVKSEPRPDSEPKLVPVLDLTELEKLTRVLKSGAVRSEKAKACKVYLEGSPDEGRHAEVGEIAKVLAARSGGAETTAWIDYLVSFPRGLVTGEALGALSRSEATVRAEIKRSLDFGDPDRAVRICRAYLRAMPGKSAGVEIKSLIGVLKLQPGPVRSRAARDHIRRHARGEFTDVLKGMAAQWARKDEVDAFEALRGRFAATRSASDRTHSLKGFLGSYPDGPHAAEVKALGLAFTQRNARERLSGARDYLKRYPGGTFVKDVQKLEAELVGQVDSELYAKTMTDVRNQRSSYAVRLAAAEKYLNKFPDGARARKVREAAAGVRRLVEDEKRAYEALDGSLQGADTNEAVLACDRFLKQHAAGAHAQEVSSRRAELKARLRGEMEAEAYRSLLKKIEGGGLSRTAKADEGLAFLRRFGRGKHAPDVKKMLTKLAPGPLRSLVGPIRAAAFSPDSSILVTVDADAGVGGSGVWVWKMPQGRLVARYQPTPGFTVCSAAFSPGSKKLWLGEETGGLLVWDISNGEIIGRFRLGGGPITAVSAPRDDSVAVTASLGDSKVRLWRSESWTPDDGLRVPGGVSAAAMSPDGKTVAAGGRDGGVLCYKTGSRDAEWTELDAHKGAVSCLVFSPRGRYVASSSAEGGTVSLRDAGSGREVWTVRDGSPSVAFVGEGSVLTGAGIRAASDGRVGVSLGGAGPVAASPDGRFALTTDGKGNGILWYLPALGQ